MGYQRRTEDKRRSPVAKFAHLYNKSATMEDRKKAQKRGKTKHKTRGYDDAM